MKARADVQALLDGLWMRGIHARTDERHRIILSGPGIEFLTEEDRAAIVAAKQDVVAALGSCPNCGATRQELADLRARRSLQAAWQAWDAHIRTCPDGCIQPGPARCPEGQRLAGIYFDRWTAWLAAVN